MPIIDCDEPFKPKTDAEKKFAYNIGEAVIIALKKYPGKASVEFFMQDLEERFIFITVNQPPRVKPATEEE